VNIPYTSLLDSSAKVLPVSRLQAIFDSAGVKRGTTVVSYCHVGQQATVVYAAALLLGYNAAVYDGSFEDWNVRGEEYPVEKPAPVQEHTSANSQGKKYSCPPCGSECDKPEYDKPGACPSCSMALIEKKL
jgi:rhodanese-related sulfurtransferase/DNA-directed RNA polymerase subunit RPC12/RpoP